MDAWRPKHVEDYDTIKCLWKWKCIKFVTLLCYKYYLAQSDRLAADRQGQGDTRLTLTPSFIPKYKYVFMVSDWNCLKYFCVHRDFLFTLYKLLNSHILCFRLATDWTVLGSNPGGGEIFRTCPDRPWGPPSLLYNGYRVFPGGRMRPGRDADPSPRSSAEV
jgi:hypothetical protein